MRVAFITNICPHYRVRTFETLAKYHRTVFFFFSAGDEWYWQEQHGTRAGNFGYEYLPGVRIGRTRISLGLIWKLLLTPCDVFIKCINGRFALPVSYLAARLRRKPFILWTGIWMSLNTPFHRLVFPLTRYVYRHSDAVVAYGEHVKRYLVTQGVDPQEIFVAHHAVDNALYARPVSPFEVTELRRRLGLAEQQRVVLYLGRLEAGKGLDFLLHAFQQLPSSDTALLFVGAGSEKSKLQQEVLDAGLAQRVRFVDYISPEDTPPYYALAYLFVLPSITTKTIKETWGLVVNEAMNQGCPVIATDAVGAAAGGLVQHGVNGFIVPERDSRELTQAMQQLLENPSLRQQMSENCRSIISTWDNERMVAGFRRAIEYACGRTISQRELPKTGLDTPDSTIHEDQAPEYTAR